MLLQKLVFCLLWYYCSCEIDRTKYSTLRRLSVQEIPYTAYARTESHSLWCIGAWLTSDFVITSAHCVFSDRGLVGFFGSSEFEAYTGCTFYIHPSYRNLNKYDYKEAPLYDVALAELDEPPTFSIFLQPITIDTSPWPPIPNNETGRSCELVGLLTVRTVFDTILTVDYFAKHGRNQCKCLSNEYVTCLKENAKACLGDCGTLLVCDGKLIGIHSKRLPADICNNKVNQTRLMPTLLCNESNTLEVFTHIPVHYAWIEERVPFSILKPSYFSLKSSAVMDHKFQKVFFTIVFWFLFK